MRHAGSDFDGTVVDQYCFPNQFRIVFITFYMEVICS